MQTPEKHRGRRRKPLCLALIGAAAGGAVLATWLALLPLPHERRGTTVTGDRAALGTCLTRALRDSPDLAGSSGIAPPLVSVLNHPGSNASRVVYQGAVQLSFVVTLTESEPGRIETHLLTFPTFDPGEAVFRAIAACMPPEPKD